jgi:uncharacterized glyoxalase superfamily protein PhnB
MKINPYLILDGNCEAAFGLYEKALNGKIAMIQRFGVSWMVNLDNT